MTVWKVDHKSNVPVFPHNPVHGAKLWDCGYEYYFFYGGLGVVEEVILHVLNDGNQTLTLSPPELVNAGPEYSIDLLGLTGNIDIAPNQELQIILKYVGPASYSNSSAELMLTSNDPDVGTCSFELEVGTTTSIADPCGCDNIIAANNAFGFLFVDVLQMSGGTIAAMHSLTTNTSGFHDATGTPFPDGGVTMFGTSPINFTFYRPPNVPLDIRVDPDFGNIMSPACTDTCNRIPTLSQWALYITTLLLLITGVTALKVKQGKRAPD